MLVRWNPYNEFNSLRRQMDDFFGRTLQNLPAEQEENGLTTAQWAPTVDIFEDEDAYTLTAEVPGLTRKEINVHVDNGRLTIEGERKQENEDKQDNYRRVERSYGRFVRAFTLPEHVDVDKIAAKCTDGVLRVTLPKKDEVKPKQIEVKVN